jgi:hypothetical protein
LDRCEGSPSQIKDTVIRAEVGVQLVQEVDERVSLLGIFLIWKTRPLGRHRTAADAPGRRFHTVARPTTLPPKDCTTRKDASSTLLLELVHAVVR